MHSPFSMAYFSSRSSCTPCADRSNFTTGICQSSTFIPFSCSSSIMPAGSGHLPLKLKSSRLKAPAPSFGSYFASFQM